MPLTDLRFRIGLGSVVALWFAVFYAGADWVMRGTRDLPSVAVPLDAMIPFWPWFAVLYLTVTPFLLLPLVMLRDQGAMIVLALTLMTEIAIAAGVYLTFPVADPPVPAGPYPAVFVLADLINLDRNNLPSLHVTLTVATLLALWGELRRYRVAVAVWAGLICASTLFTHQHDLMSVSAGLVLAVAGQVVLVPLFRRLVAARG